MTQLNDNSELLPEAEPINIPATDSSINESDNGDDNKLSWLSYYEELYRMEEIYRETIHDTCWRNLFPDDDGLY